MTTVHARPTLRVTGSPAGVDQWTDVARVPNAPARAAAARWVFHHAVARIPLRVREASGREYGGGTAGDPVMRIERPGAFFRRLGRTGTVGFGEAYMAADWTTDDLSGVLTAFAANMDTLVPRALRPLRHVVLRRTPEAHDNSLSGARENIHHHYDLSNELFATFLDPTLVYSCAIFDGEPSESAEPLQAAQQRKIDRLLDCAGVVQGKRVLEIGTGWGELAIRAARRGAEVTTLTLSTEQADLARDRIEAEGLSDRVNVMLTDYREIEGSFDAVVSVEMIEAVGAKHWSEYFATIDRLLRPGGRVGLQAILQRDRTVRETGQTYTWIRKYIFPGGQLASAEAIADILATDTSLRIADTYRFGRHYAQTLKRWRAAFEQRAADVERLGFDETFRRMWSLYLAYSEAGFATGYLDVAQLTLTKPSPANPSAAPGTVLG